ncbi:unnamed protein product [Trichobilharzia szidati]|nr:unnamed protein product [Trichobilharzia szidati]
MTVHTFLCVVTPLQPPYDGPFKVVSRKEKFFVIDRLGRQDTVSVDRLKAAYIEESVPLTPTQPATTPAPTPQPSSIVENSTKPSSSPDETSKAPITRSGRRVHWPKR